MLDLFFLESSVPLVKKFTLNKNGELEKQSYPNIKNFTSHKVSVNTIKQLYTAITKHSALGHCLLKGPLTRDLVNESRKGSTNTEDLTQLFVLDLDDAPFKTPEEFTTAHPALYDVSHVVQYSASQGLTKTSNTLSCHLFFILDKPVPAPYLKAWLMSQNLNGDVLNGRLRQALTLSSARAALHYTLDITSCQNDKLIYIAWPDIDKHIKYSLKQNEFIQLVPRKLAALPADRLQHTEIEVWKKEARELVNALREKAGLDPIKGQSRWVGNDEVLSKPGEAILTGAKPDGEWVRLNLNGGTSWPYYHALDNFEIIRNFKGEHNYLTKELLPDYYKRLKAAKERVDQAAKEDRNQTTQISDQGATLLAFRDMRSAQYWNGTWNEATQTLNINPAKSELQLDHFMRQHNRQLGEFIPLWTMEFDPTSNIVCAEEERYLNTYVPTEYYRSKHSPAPNLKRCPIIERVILSAVSGNEHNEVTEHFLNWLAVIFQHRIKTKTAWVLHGTEGTGKGVIVNDILKPLLGHKYVPHRLIRDLEERYTGWLENAIVAFVDEIQVSTSSQKDIITSVLKNAITEPFIAIRNMHRQSYDAASFVNFIFGSNMPDPVIIAVGDRRFNVGIFQDTKLVLNKRQVEVELVKELPYFMDYIMQRQADVDLAGQVLKTEARQTMIDASRTSINMLVDALLDGDLTPFIDALPDMKLLAELNGANSALGVAYDSIIRRELQLIIDTQPDSKGVCSVPSRFTRDELLVIFEFCIGGMPQSPNKFTRLLKHKGIETKRMQIGTYPNHTLSYGIELTWIATKQWQDENRSFTSTAKPKRLSLVK